MLALQLFASQKGLCALQLAKVCQVINTTLHKPKEERIEELLNLMVV